MQRLFSARSRASEASVYLPYLLQTQRPLQSKRAGLLRANKRSSFYRSLPQWSHRRAAMWRTVSMGCWISRGRKRPWAFEWRHWGLLSVRRHTEPKVFALTGKHRDNQEGEACGLVSAMGGMEPVFHPEAWEWMWLITWWPLLSVGPGITQISQTIMFITDSPSLDLCLERCFSVSRTHPLGRCHMYFRAQRLQRYLYDWDPTRS